MSDTGRQANVVCLAGTYRVSIQLVELVVGCHPPNNCSTPSYPRRKTQRRFSGSKLIDDCPACRNRSELGLLFMTSANRSNRVVCQLYQLPKFGVFRPFISHCLTHDVQVFARFVLKPLTSVGGLEQHDSLVRFFAHEGTKLFVALN